jgi:hypothetical protein
MHALIALESNRAPAVSAIKQQIRNLSHAYNDRNQRYRSTQSTDRKPAMFVLRNTHKRATKRLHSCAKWDDEDSDRTSEIIMQESDRMPVSIVLNVTSIRLLELKVSCSDCTRSCTLESYCTPAILAFRGAHKQMIARLQ